MNSNYINNKYNATKVMHFWKFDIGVQGNIIFIREILIDFKPTNMTMESSNTIK